MNYFIYTSHHCQYCLETKTQERLKFLRIAVLFAFLIIRTFELSLDFRRLCFSDLITKILRLLLKEYVY